MCGAGHQGDALGIDADNRPIAVPFTALTLDDQPTAEPHSLAKHQSLEVLICFLTEIFTIDKELTVHAQLALAELRIGRVI